MNLRKPLPEQKIADALAKKDLLSLHDIEDLLADTEIQTLLDRREFDQTKKKLDEIYKNLIKKFTQELVDLHRFIISQLEDITNLGKETPISHQNVVTAFNNLDKFIPQEILAATTLEKRTLILKRYIAVAVQLKEKPHRDFHGVAAITSSLHSNAVQTLKTCLVNLSEEEVRTLKDFENLIVRDQGWQAMNACISRNQEFIPNFAGVKRKLIRGEEGRDAHDMEADFLQKSGKLKSSDKKTTTEKEAKPTPDPLAKKFQDILSSQRKQNKLTLKTLTSLQIRLLPYTASPALTIIAINSNLEQEIKAAKAFEFACAPAQIFKLKNQLQAAIVSLGVDRVNKPESATDKKRNTVIDNVLQKCDERSAATYGEQIKLLTTLIDEDKALQKHQASVGGIYKIMIGRETTIINKLRLIRDILEKLHSLEQKRERLKRESDSSYSSITTSHSQRNSGIGIPLNDLSDSNRSHHGSAISSRSNVIAEDVSDESSSRRSSQRRSMNPQLVQFLNLDTETTEENNPQIDTRPRSSADPVNLPLPVSMSAVITPTCTTKPVEATEDKTSLSEKVLKRTTSLLKQSNSAAAELSSSKRSIFSLSTLRGKDPQKDTQIDKRPARATSERNMGKIQKTEDKKQPKREASLKSVNSTVFSSPSHKKPPPSPPNANSSSPRK